MKYKRQCAWAFLLYVCICVCTCVYSPTWAHVWAHVCAGIHTHVCTWALLCIGAKGLCQLSSLVPPHSIYGGEIAR